MVQHTEEQLHYIYKIDSLWSNIISNMSIFRSKWFISSVYSDLCFKITLLYQGLDKLKYFFPSVCRAMNIKIVFRWEGIITLTALIWVLTSVCLKVCF